MGLFNKLKNVLFEEEEIEETPINEVEEPKLEVNNKIEPLIEEQESEYKPLPEQKPEVLKPNKPLFVEEESNNFSERELFRSESTFKFPAFDEDEFNTSMPHLKEEEKRSNNVLDYERRQKQDRRNDYSRIDRDSSDTKAREEVKRFKPSPVISPVYGILDKDYKKEDIVSVPKDQDNGVISSKDLDVDTVRAKAFGKLNSSLASSENNKSIKEKVVAETYDIKKEEPKKEVEEEIKIDDVIITSEPIIDDSAKLREERSKTIDELLKDASDEVIDVTDDVTKVVDDIDIDDITLPDYEKIESEIDDALDSVIDEIPEDLPEEKEEVIETKKEDKNPLDSDTLESDLYDLIDSMYDNTEDGE